MDGKLLYNCLLAVNKNGYEGVIQLELRKYWNISKITYGYNSLKLFYNAIEKLLIKEYRSIYTTIKESVV